MIERDHWLYIKIKKTLLEKIKRMGTEERIPSRPALMQEFNVNRGTVDRAVSELIGEGYLYSISGSGTYIRERLEDAAAKKDSLRWGLIIPDILNDTYPGILRGVEDVAQRSGISVFIGNTDERRDKQDEYIRNFVQANVDGVIIIPAIEGLAHSESFEPLIDRGIPYVLCSRFVEGIRAPRVLSNNYRGGYIVTNHLIQQGYRRIGFLSHPVYTPSVDRYMGYVAALDEAGIELNEDWVLFEDSFLENPGYESAKAILNKDHRPDAFFCFTDAVAKGAFDAIMEMGYHPGTDIGLAGYNDTAICETLPVKLTSVRFRSYDIGVKAGELLLKSQEGVTGLENKIEILQPELVIRESSRGGQERIGSSLAGIDKIGGTSD